MVLAVGRGSRVAGRLPLTRPDPRPNPVLELHSWGGERERAGVRLLADKILEAIRRAAQPGCEHAGQKLSHERKEKGRLLSASDLDLLSGGYP